MIDFAEKLSNGIPFLRADFYNVDESVYFGELTFYPASGFGPFSPEEFDFIMGRWLSLPEKSGGGYIFITQDIFVRLEKREELIDYKFYCFDGEPKFLYVAVAGFIDGERHDKLTYLDLNWDRTLFGRSDHQLLPFDVRKPNHLDEMIDIARKLSTDIPFVRVDLYNINDKVYFSELTFYPGSGLGLFSPETAEMEIGSWIDLSKV